MELITFIMLYRLCDFGVPDEMQGNVRTHAKAWHAYLSFRVDTEPVRPFVMALKTHFHGEAKVNRFEECGFLVAFDYILALLYAASALNG